MVLVVVTILAEKYIRKKWRLLLKIVGAQQKKNTVPPLSFSRRTLFFPLQFSHCLWWIASNWKAARSDGQNIFGCLCLFIKLMEDFTAAKQSEHYYSGAASGYASIYFPAWTRSGEDTMMWSHQSHIVFISKREKKVFSFFLIDQLLSSPSFPSFSFFRCSV